MNHSGIYYGTDTDNGSVFSARTSDGGDNLVISDGSQNGTTILTPIPGVLYYAEELNGDILYVLTNDKGNCMFTIKTLVKLKHCMTVKDR